MMCLSIAKVLVCMVLRVGAFNIPHITTHGCTKEYYLMMVLTYKIHISWDGILLPSFARKIK